MMAAWQAAAIVWLLMWTAAAMRGASASSATGGTSTAAFDALNRMLRESLVIECQRTGIRVSFKRPSLEAKGIPAQALSFLDTSCRASNNGTHYVLTTTFAACGGMVNRDLGMIYNSIKLLDPADFEAVDVSRAQPSFRRWSRRAAVARLRDDEDGESSGSGDGPPPRGGGDPASAVPAYAAAAATAGAGASSLVASSPEPDLAAVGRTHLLSVPFGCYYSNRTQTQASIAESGRAGAALPSLAARWKLNMSVAFFSSDSFVAQLRPYPLRVAVGDDLFVQVSPEGGGVGDHSALRVVVNSCYLTSTAGEGGSKRVTLVDHGCASQGSLLTWHGEDELAPHRRFSFRVAQQFPTFSFLHCSVDLCSLRPPPSGVDPSSAAQPKPCTTQAQHCALSSPSDADRVEAFRVNSGALMIVSSKQPGGLLPMVGGIQPRRDRPPTGRSQQQPHAFLGSSSSSAAGGSKASAVAAAATVAGEPPTAVAPALPQPQSLPPNVAGGRGESAGPAATAPAAGGAAAAAAAGGGIGLPVGTVIGIAVGAFVVGCATVGALWLIHTCTDPRRRLLAVPTTEDSGSQTSRSPMSV